jgi:diaminohydroxyphosphoribosylaminopyrimidine deaminase/5-amino-6-(5-phosphoribosylamino)uracil reductase
MTNILIEAGGKLVGSFFDQRLVNEVHAFIAPLLAGGHGAPSPIAGTGVDVMGNAFRLQNPEIQLLEEDVYVRGVMA